MHFWGKLYSNISSTAVKCYGGITIAIKLRQIRPPTAVAGLPDLKRWSPVFIAGQYMMCAMITGIFIQTVVLTCVVTCRRSRLALLATVTLCEWR